ncbi:outer membrane protein OmpA-like peptidoglycan-associated protein [Aquabacterium commune]|uniref:Outer membrane protein OmpA-like peptidoglycan-associated protein n=1 Tax=Aquabacterium commune TaxID=70586 RepID=A0A4R6QZB9_9BURK|nr:MULTISPECIES: OmpA family protein [Aquabacterium]TDP78663.1 outer membrane protein OmpA-like peptidoglycan-associated protein [Aquabacterium commune]
MNTIKRWSMERDAAYIHAILSCLRRHGPLVGAAEVLQQSVSYLRARHPQGGELEDAVHLRRVVRALLGLLATGNVRSWLWQGQVCYALPSLSQQCSLGLGRSGLKPFAVPMAVAAAAVVAGCASSHDGSFSSPRYSYFVEPGLHQELPIARPQPARLLAEPFTRHVARVEAVAEAGAASGAPSGKMSGSTLAVAGTPEVREAAKQVLVQPELIEASVHFAYARSQLGLDGLAELRALVPRLRDAASIRLIGRADPTGQPAMNARLAQARADSVAVQLKRLGIKPDKIRAQACDKCWVAPEKLDAATAQLRRVDIEVRFPTVAHD